MFGEGGGVEEESFASGIIQITALVMSFEQNNWRKVTEDLMWEKNCQLSFLSYNFLQVLTLDESEYEKETNGFLWPHDLR